MSANNSIGQRLEKYTVRRSQEVLIVAAEIDGEIDEISIFKGYSSSLTKATAFDPDVPVLPENAKIIAIDRAIAPYNPAAPRYLQPGLTLEAMEALLAEVGV